MRPSMPPCKNRLIAALLAMCLAAHLDCASALEQSAMSSTVIGTNLLLAEGAGALSAGEWQRGIQLTELGLAAVVSRNDRAVGLANLCAGYAGMKQFAKALALCNQSLDLDDGNWRTWQNRAACHLGLGKVEESLSDVQRGLDLNPDAESLQQTLVIIRQYERSQQDRLQHLLES